MGGEPVRAADDTAGAAGRLVTEEVAAEPGVSAATTRRDLDHLAEQRLLGRTRGGAVGQAVSCDLPMRYKASRAEDEKQPAARIADELSLDITFIGVDGLDPVLGATARDEGEAELNRVFARYADRVVVVAHSAKPGRRTLARICGTDEVDILVTDGNATDQSIARYPDRGVDVRSA